MVDAFSTTPSLKSLWAWWFTIPLDLAPDQRRIAATASAGIPLGWLLHFLYVFLFAYWEVWPLMIANIFSVALWTAGIIFAKQRRYNHSYAVIAFEIIVHGALAMRYLGWGFGVQYYLFVLLLEGFSMPWTRWINMSMTAVFVILFTSFYYYTQFYSPLAEVPQLQLVVTNIVNIMAAFGLSAAVTLYSIIVADQAEIALEAEHIKSEALLNNVLPTSIAARLKQNSGTIADYFPHASILFADIVGFTPFSEQISPEKLVIILNEIFSRFDELVDKYELGKIKTIGDAYMVASGIPTPREDHAEALVLLALDMRDALHEYNCGIGANLQVRIGLNSGPVVAGVIGKRRLLYDLWGDSVNTASRMESQGMPGKIQTTGATRQLLDDQFIFSERGIIHVKGKGEMQVHFLHGHRNSYDGTS